MPSHLFRSLRKDTSYITIEWILAYFLQSTIQYGEIKKKKQSMWGDIMLFIKAMLERKPRSIVNLFAWNLIQIFIYLEQAFSQISILLSEATLYRCL